MLSIGFWLHLSAPLSLSTSPLALSKLSVLTALSSLPSRQSLVVIPSLTTFPDPLDWARCPSVLPNFHLFCFYSVCATIVHPSPYVAITYIPASIPLPPCSALTRYLGRFVRCKQSELHSCQGIVMERLNRWLEILELEINI